MQTLFTHNQYAINNTVFILLLFICFHTSKAQEVSSKTGHAAVSSEADPAENWNTLSLPSGGLHADEPILVAKDEEPDYTHEFWRVQWRSGDPIDLFVIRPKGVPKPPVILYLYSYPSETDLFMDHSSCKFLVKNGFAAVGFVSALTGHRYHDRPMKEWFISELQESLATSTHDVQMILNFLSTRKDLDMDRVGMFGDGSGASIAILAAAVDSRIKTLDLIDPWGSWPEWMAKSTLIPENERPSFVKPEFLKNVAGLDPVQWLPKLKSQTVRLQDVSDVTVTPDDARKHIESSAPSTVSIVRYKDRKEFFQNTVKEGKALDWLKQHTALERIQQYHANKGMSESQSVN